MVCTMISVCLAKPRDTVGQPPNCSYERLPTPSKAFAEFFPNNRRNIRREVLNMLTMAPLPRPHKRILYRILEVFRRNACWEMGMDDVAHLGGSKSVGILQRAKVGSVAKFNFWAKSKNLVSGIQ